MLKHFWFRFYSHISYRIKAVDAHGLHSPFLFELYNEVIRPSKKFQLNNVEKLRNQLYDDHQLIDLYDLKTNQAYRQTVNSIAKKSLSTRKFSSFLYHLAGFLSCQKIVETGTSIGINALYLAGSEKVNQVVTLEASPILCEMAKKQFSQLLQHKIEVIRGTLDETFEAIIIKEKPDLCFLDADHRSVAVKKCIDTIMLHHPEIRCIVVHDIYWSEDMTQAWMSFVKDSRFRLTIDLFQAGIIFPSMEMPKQHFTIRF